MTVHVTVFSAATDEWARGVDARMLLTIEFSFILLPINAPLATTFEQGRDTDGPLNLGRGSKISVAVI